MDLLGQMILPCKLCLQASICTKYLSSNIEMAIMSPFTQAEVVETQVCCKHLSMLVRNFYDFSLWVVHFLSSRNFQGMWKVVDMVEVEA